MVGDGDLVKVKNPPADYHGETMRVERIHYAWIPVLRSDGKVAIAECLRPDKDNPDKFSDPNRFESWPADQLDKVKKKAKRGESTPDPEREKPDGEGQTDPAAQ